MFQYQAAQTGQVTVTAAATQIVPAFPSRSGIVINNTGSTACYIGENANVTAATGFFLPGTAGASVSFSSTGAIYGITAGGSAVLSFLQTN